MAITDPEKVRPLVSNADKLPDDVFRNAWDAAENYVETRVEYPTGTDEGGNPILPPAALVEAVVLLTARYLQRRNSPDGFIGLGELGVARVPVTDRDVDRLMAPHLRVVIG